MVKFCKVCGSDKFQHTGKFRICQNCGDREKKAIESEEKQLIE